MVGGIDLSPTILIIKYMKNWIQCTQDKTEITVVDLERKKMLEKQFLYQIQSTNTLIKKSPRPETPYINIIHTNSPVNLDHVAYIDTTEGDKRFTILFVNDDGKTITSWQFNNKVVFTLNYNNILKTIEHE